MYILIRYHSISFIFIYVLIFTLQIFRAKELLDNTLALIKNVMSGAIIDPDRLVIGTEEGLFCLDLDRSGMFYPIYIYVCVCVCIQNHFVMTNLYYIFRNCKSRRRQENIFTGICNRRTINSSFKWKTTSCTAGPSTCIGWR